MGEYAEYFLYDVAEEENLIENQYDLSLEEAYDLGLTDHYGATDRLPTSGSMSLESITQELELCTAQFDNLCSKTNGYSYDTTFTVVLNKSAVENLKKASPTCNVCSKLMKSRTGKYGKFYYCSCEGQPTVSDSYWQSVRIK
jgi:hypothetical protein